MEENVIYESTAVNVLKSTPNVSFWRKLFILRVFVRNLLRESLWRNICSNFLLLKMIDQGSTHYLLDYGDDGKCSEVATDNQN